MTTRLTEPDEHRAQEHRRCEHTEGRGDASNVCVLLEDLGEHRRQRHCTGDDTDALRSAAGNGDRHSPPSLGPGEQTPVEALHAPSGLGGAGRFCRIFGSSNSSRVMRWRNTQYAHAWYTTTIGTKITDTIVMTLSE